ncbi:hypothetical protein HYH03_013876 [Edaphochlamys debaryana]|uniref:Uncharacterized protein n=1 Tax=Edaphochlamys debaryana TaxID=47281 RepID=A0A835XRG2_9CHLO|nr:hypothetical protein HYH03_013876 [Edaphochlamys debaryana]|eukprot:KAG2487598.1 hypothetical protein HYH03_013876 [Edaphochlamys debaryana]
MVGKGQEHAGARVEDPQHVGIAADLTPHGEAALCAVADFLAGRMDDNSRIGLACLAEKRPFLIRGVGGAAEAGPGRRSHSAWLEALGRAGVPRLNLDRLALSQQDFEALAGHTALKALKLGRNVEYPLPALLSLPLAPRLERLELDLHAWCHYRNMVEGEEGDAVGTEEEEDGGSEGGGEAGSEAGEEAESESESEGEVGDSGDEGDPGGAGESQARVCTAALPPDLRGVLTALLCKGRRLRVALLHGDVGGRRPHPPSDLDGPSLRARRLLTALAADVRSAVERLAGDGGRLQAQGSMSTGPRGL